MAVDQAEITFKVRYAETDQMGVVHHSKYAVYFEMGRTELMRACGVSYRQMEETGALFVVAKLSTHFLAPARYDDDLRLVTRTSRLTRARIEHEYELYRQSDNRLITKATSTIACVDSDGQIIAIPEEFMQYFEAK